LASRKTRVSGKEQQDATAPRIPEATRSITILVAQPPVVIVDSLDCRPMGVSIAGFSHIVEVDNHRLTTRVFLEVSTFIAFYFLGLCMVGFPWASQSFQDPPVTVV